jgi:radical SAM superfamily enzyme YgiQ (UPF0313 family)
VNILLTKCPRARTSYLEENNESLALGYLAAALRENGFQVEILNAVLLGIGVQETIEKIVAKDWNLIGFTIADPAYIHPTFRIANSIRTMGSRAHMTIGGYTPTFQWKEVLEACSAIDSVVRFEGEQTIIDLAIALKNHADWDDIQNLAFRRSSEFVSNPARPVIESLDSLPFPARDTLSYILRHTKETGVASVCAGRGCYARCSFCAVRAFYGGCPGSLWRARSIENIVDEIEYLSNHWGIREIYFVDDIFIGPGEKGIERAYHFADEIDRRGLEIMFSISERVDNVTYDVFKRLYDIGVRQTLVGVEAATQETLDIFRKCTTIDQNRTAIRLLQDLGIDVAVSFINFFEKSTIQELRTNLSFLLSLSVNFLSGLLNRFTFYYGTPIAEEMLRTGKVKGSFPNYTYDFEDRSVDTVFQVVKNTLGPYLLTYHGLKRLERKFRVVYFEREARSQDTIDLKEAKRQFKLLEASIIKEASDMFSSILDFAESSSKISESEISLFSEEVADVVRKRFMDWKNEIVFFETFSPCFSSGKDAKRCLPEAYQARALT